MTPRIAAIILAAGQARRMGANKLLADIAGKPVIRHTVEAVCASTAAPIIVVVGHQSDDVRTAVQALPVKIVENADYAEGLSTSLICGVKSLPDDMDGFLVALGDMPLVSPQTIDAMAAHFDPSAGHSIIVPVCGGRRGNPVLWAAALRAEFYSLTGDKGAKHLMALHADLVYELEIQTTAVLTDIDTPEDLCTLRQ